MTDIKPNLPAETSGTDVSRFNALRHGILSRYTVLPWEDADEYRGLICALMAEHTPEGPTEEHLVEELAGILWRKRRLRLAEAATHRRGLENTFASYRHIVKVALVHLDVQEESERVIDAIQATPPSTEAAIADVQEDETMSRRALDLLGSNRNDAYEAATAALREDTQQWWTYELQCNPNDLDDGEEPFSPNGESLRRFIEQKVLPSLETRRKELSNRPLIREQAFGESLDPDKLERLARYEVHLDRKLEALRSIVITPQRSSIA
jgi:hypothetical protein